MQESNPGCIRRTIKPAFGSMPVRNGPGPLLDTFYARLIRCGNLACTGKPFTEHRTGRSTLKWDLALISGSGAFYGDLSPAVTAVGWRDGLC
jgi:hypothetical protein